MPRRTPDWHARAIADAISKMRPKRGDGLESVSISVRGKGGVKMNRDGSNERICKHGKVEAECDLCGS